ncbi:MAG: hypothetical protein ACRELS_04265 [Candidatus Rokuibacteriota bacterium]
MAGEPAELKGIGWQFLIAAVRFFMLLAFIGGHWLLLQATTLIVPPEWHRARVLLEVLFYGAFIVLYLDQLLQMLAIFIPVLGGLRKRVTGGQNTGGAT